MTEATALPFDTPLGPVLPAAMYVAVCAWPDSWPQRDKLVEALLHSAARRAGYRHPGPDLRVLERRLDRCIERLHKGFEAAEVAQLATSPAELRFGALHIQLPSRHATGPSGEPSVKRLQALAATGWKPPADPRDLAPGDDDFRTRVWRRFLPAMPYIIEFKMHVHASKNTDLVDLVLNPSWLDAALSGAEFWHARLSSLERVPAEFITLVRA